VTNSVNDDRVWARFYRDNRRVEEIAEEFGYSVEQIDGVRKPLVHFTETITKLDRIFASERRQLVDAIHNLQHERLEDSKVMTNLADALDALSGRKQAEREAKRKEEAKKLKVRRNGNYLQSVKLGLHRGLWLAPTVLLSALREPILGLFGSAAMLVFRLTMFVLGCIGMPVLGLLGMISPAPKPAE
jgi:hypothetical protein